MSSPQTLPSVFLSLSLLPWKKEHQFPYSLPPLAHFLFPCPDEFSSVQFSRSVVSNSLQPHESQHSRPPCPSPIPGVHSNSCPSSWWCHPAISSSVVPFSSCPQSLPASESVPMSQLFVWGGQSIQVSASASSNEHPELISFRMYWLDLLAVQGTLKSLLQHHTSKASCPTLCNPMDCIPPGSSVHGVGCSSLLQGSNPGLLHYRQILYHLSHKGSPWYPRGMLGYKSINSSSLPSKLPILPLPIAPLNLWSMLLPSFPKFGNVS